MPPAPHRDLRQPPMPAHRLAASPHNHGVVQPHLHPCLQLSLSPALRTQGRCWAGRTQPLFSQSLVHPPCGMCSRAGQLPHSARPSPLATKPRCVTLARVTVALFATLDHRSPILPACLDNLLLRLYQGVSVVHLKQPPCCLST